jgi:hypothetical protein
MLSTNVGRVIGLGKEIVKERVEQPNTESALDTEFVIAMKGMGEVLVDSATSAHLQLCCLCRQVSSLQST